MPITFSCWSSRRRRISRRVRFVYTACSNALWICAAARACTARGSNDSCRAFRVYAHARRRANCGVSSLFCLIANFKPRNDPRGSARKQTQTPSLSLSLRVACICPSHLLDGDELAPIPGELVSGGADDAVRAAAHNVDERVALVHVEVHAQYVVA